jgi:hypothetical protein
MTLSTRSIAALVLLVVAMEPSGAQTATQLVRFRVLVHQAADVAPMAAPLTLRGRAAAATTGTYAFAANEADRKITASLDQAMPAGSSLVLAMTAPAGARSAGEITLGTDDVDVVTAIPASQSSGLPVRFVVRAPAGLESPEQRLVTYTVTAAP